MEEIELQDAQPINEQETEVETDAPEQHEEPKAEKPKETPAQKAARLKRQLKRLERDNPDLRDEDEEDDERPAPKQKTGVLDYGQLAYLTAKGIEADDEVALVREIIRDTGKSLRDVVSSKYFQAELKELRDDKTVKEATPSASKRSSAAQRDNIDFWLTKPFSEVPKDLKSKVLAAKEARLGGNGPFYNS